VGATGIPNTGFATFSSLIINGLGFIKFHSLPLTMSFGAVCIVTAFGAGWINRRFKEMRFYMMIAVTIPASAGSLLCSQGPRDTPYLVSCLSFSPKLCSTVEKYAGIVLMPFQIAANAIGVSMVLSNVAGHTKKAITSGITFYRILSGKHCRTLVYHFSSWT